MKNNYNFNFTEENGRKLEHNFYMKDDVANYTFIFI